MSYLKKLNMNSLTMSEIAILLLISLNFALCKADFNLEILHTNDMHSRFLQTNKLSGECSPQDAKTNSCYGGFARVSTAVKTARFNFQKQNIQSLFLIAGDIYQGTIMYTFYKWRIAAKLTSMLNPDAMSLGNHEFDDGVEGLVPFINEVKFPVLACNLNKSSIPPNLAKTHLKNSHVFNIGGQNVAVIGYVTPDTKFMSQAADVDFLDEVESIKAEIKELKQNDRSIKIFIALGHSGFDVDKKIAANVPDIDAVIGGHTNTFLYSGNQPDNEVPEGLYPTIVEQPSGRKVPVVQAYAYTKYLGQLSLKFNDDGEVISTEGNPLLLDHKVEQDPFILQELNYWTKNTSILAAEKIGETKVLLEGETTACRLKECNLGNLLTDAYIDYMARLHKLKYKPGWTEIPIAVQHGGGIRSSIDALSKNGNVTMGDILSVLPFVNNMVELKLNGSDMLEMLERSVENYDTSRREGKFLQYSGLIVEYDVSKPNGKRVKSVLARCGKCRVPAYEPLKKDQTYSIIVPEFIALGGDDYKVLKRNYRKDSLIGMTDTDMVTEYFKRKSPVYPGVEGRIIFVNKKGRSDSDNAASMITHLVFLPMLASLLTINIS